jgi:hypothetical protein
MRPRNAGNGNSSTFAVQITGTTSPLYVLVYIVGESDRRLASWMTGHEGPRQ